MSGFAQDTYGYIQNAIQVKLSNVILLLLTTLEPNPAFVCLYISCCVMLFHFLKLDLFMDVSFLMLVTLVFQMLNAFNRDVPLGIVIVNISTVFLSLQIVVTTLKIKLFQKLIGNIQYIIADLITKTLYSVLIYDYIVVVILLITMMLFYFFDYRNSDLMGLYSLATISSVQQLLLTNLPVIFLVPTIIILIYVLQMILIELQCAEMLMYFITYNAAVILQSSLKAIYSNEVVLFIGGVSVFVIQYMQMRALYEVSKTLCIIVAVDVIMLALAGLYYNDPILCLVVVLFGLRVFVL